MGNPAWRDDAEAQALIDAIHSTGSLYIAVWEDDGLLNAQAYTTRTAALRDFPDATIIESTVQS